MNKQKINEILRDEGGFTLLELMIVLVIVMVGAAIWLSTDTTDPEKNSVQRAAKEFYGLVQYAKTDAIQSGRHVFIRPIGEGVNQTGFEVIRDEDGNETISDDDTGALVQLKFEGGTKLENEEALIRFNHKGYLVDDAGNPVISRVITFCGKTTCKQDGASYTTVTITIAGMPKIDYEHYEE